MEDFHNKNQYSYIITRTIAHHASLGLSRILRLHMADLVLSLRAFW